jgi:hypothetical protein
MAKTYRDPVDWSVRVVDPDKPNQRERNDRFTDGPTTDINAWLADNGPRNCGELKELRRALYSRETYGSFAITHRCSSRSGEPRFSVAGREGSLLVVSDKSRHFLLRTLCRIAKRL